MADNAFRDSLTPQETLVLELIMRGSTSREAARLLGVSHRTVEFHRANIMQKSSARNMVDLVRMMFQSGEISA